MNKFSISSPTDTDLQVAPLKMELRCEEYKHDVLTFHGLAGSTSLLTPFVSGTPVFVRWMCSPSSGEFYGYIDKVGTEYYRIGDAVVSPNFEVRCIGTTYPLKTEDTTTYVNASVSTVLETLAKKFMLASYISAHDVHWPVLAQGNESWWTFAVKLAKRVGYTLFARGATLCAFDRRTAIGNFSAHQYNLVRHPRDAFDVMYFEPKSSSGSGIGGSAPGVHTINGISASTGTAFSRSTRERAQSSYTGNDQPFAPLFQRVIQQAPRSLAEAEAHLDAAEACNMFSQRASMTILGNSNISVGSIIELFAAYEPLYAGTWFVLGVTHQFERDKFISVLDLGKDAAGTPYPYPPQTAVLSRQRNPGVLFRNGRWTAAWSTT